MRKRRRQAAWICFEPYLSEVEKLQAIEILEQEFQIDGAIHLLAYVAKISLDLGIHLKYRKKLYAHFEKLLSDPNELNTIDPLFEMSNPVATPKTEIQAPVATIAEDQVKAKPQPLGATELPVYMKVFITFIKYVLDYTPDQLELFTELLDLTIDPKSKTDYLAKPITTWINDPYNFHWAENLNQQALTDVLNLVYTALCEVLGPVATDDCFHKALKFCEQQPEGRLFSAAQFL